MLARKKTDEYDDNMGSAPLVRTRTNNKEICVPPSEVPGVNQDRICIEEFSNHTLWPRGVAVLSFPISRYSFRLYRRRFHKDKMPNGPIIEAKQ